MTGDWLCDTHLSAYGPFNSLHKEAVNSTSCSLSPRAIYPSRYGGSALTVHWPWVLHIDFQYRHTDGGSTEGFLTWLPACRCDWEQISEIPIRHHLPRMMDHLPPSHQFSPAGERVTPVWNLSSYTTSPYLSNNCPRFVNKTPPTQFARKCLHLEIWILWRKGYCAVDVAHKCGKKI